MVHVELGVDRFEYLKNNRNDDEDTRATDGQRGHAGDAGDESWHDRDQPQKDGPDKSDAIKDKI